MEQNESGSIFRAEYPDQLWQGDIKGPFTIEGKRMLALVIIDDNSRYLISSNLHASITADEDGTDQNNPSAESTLSNCDFFIGFSP